MPPKATRRFLLLQGPHGPFFARLGEALRATGAEVWRVAFNRGDAWFWTLPERLLRHTGPPEDWPAHLDQILRRKDITDLVLYGDTRPIHSVAVAVARARGITVHVFEEGYLRPYWVSYERGGSNGHSPLMRRSIADMAAALGPAPPAPAEAPARWGDLREHIFYGALYHFFVLALNRPFRAFRPHRAQTVAEEFRLYLRRLLLLPAHALERRIATWRVQHACRPFHLALLQLEHDASFRFHSPFASQTEFIDLVIGSFAQGAPPDHHLVFKAHPLEDGRAPISRAIRQAARRHRLSARVHFLRGGKLAPLLAQARSAVTVNSTSGEQALWRGIALRALGQAVYGKPELISDQPLPAFFRTPKPPDPQAYRIYRSYLLATSQVPGGFYSARGRAQLLPRIVALMLAPHGPYDSVFPAVSDANLGGHASPPPAVAARMQHPGMAQDAG